jgi:hypothetical protein
MDLADPELVVQLEARDGPLGTYWRPHSAGGICRYQEVYKQDCPWCEAENRRRQRESAGANRGMTSG